ncbi:MAG: hypothetical protein WBA77_03705 [Microcoleaceae cyanobacterium]
MGYDVAIDSQLALVSAVRSDAKGFDSGSVDVFDLETGRKIKNLSSEDIRPEDLFGYSLAFAQQGTNNFAIVSAPYTDHEAKLDSGVVYVFDLESGEAVRTLVPQQSQAGDLFGYDVAVSGNRAFISAAYRDAKGTDSGLVYVFDWTTGEQLDTLSPSDHQAGDVLGYSLAVSGNNVLVGSAYHDAQGLDSGAVYLFDGTTGKQLAKLTPDDAQAGDVFGSRIESNSRYALISAIYSDPKGVDSGAVYLFDLSTGEQVRKFIADDGGAGDLFGHGLSMNNQFVLIGSAYDDEGGSKVDLGAAYLFDLATGQQLEKLTAPERQSGALFGYAVAMNGNTFLIASPYEDVRRLQRSRFGLFIPIYALKK